MEFSNILFHKRLIRYYFSYPNYIFSLFNRPLPPSLSSCPETLNPSCSLTPPNSIFHSHELHTTPTSRSPFSVISSTGSPSFSQSIYYLPIFVHNISLLRPLSIYRLLSVSSSLSIESTVPEKTREFENNVDVKQVSEIVEIIKNGGDDMESKLNMMVLNLSVKSISAVFRVLNCERVSALQFFEWVREKDQNLCSNPKLCSLVINNCGWLGDYETMTCLLKDFTSKRICLTEEAFGFVPFLDLSKDVIMESARRVIAVLNEVKGSCRGSGISGLINLLCKVDLFEIAKYGVEIAERDVSYYNILVQDRCNKCRFKEARELIAEMRRFGCNPNAKTYNYMLSNLCRDYKTAEACSLLEEMQEKGCSPDELTFELLIYLSCRQRKFDIANQFLDRMISRGLEPRVSTHAAFIKGYFDSKQYEDAYKYVVSSGTKYTSLSHNIYSLLANLHREKGDLVVARNILTEMMDKGLKPNFSVYVRVSKRLFKSGRGDLARDLKIRFSRFKQVSETVTW